MIVTSDLLACVKDNKYHYIFIAKNFTIVFSRAFQPLAVFVLALTGRSSSSRFSIFDVLWLGKSSLSPQ